MKKNKIMIITIATLSVVAVLAVAWLKPSASIKTADIQNTTTIEKRRVAQGISVTGTVKSAENESITSTLMNQKVKEVYVEVGDIVNAGDVLAVFDTSNIERSFTNAQENLAVSNSQNNLSIQGAQRGVQSAEDTKAYQLASGQQDVATAEKNLTDAQADVDKYTIELADKRKEEQDFKKKYDAALAAYEAIKGPYEEWSDKLTLAQAAYDVAAAEKEVANPGYGQEAQEALEDANTNLNYIKAEYHSFKGDYDIKNKKYTETKKDYDTSKSERESLETKLENAQKSLTNAKNSYDTSVRNKDNTLNSQNNNIQNQYDSLQNTKLSASNNTQTVKSQLEDYEDQLKEGVVISLISGMVTEVSITADTIYTGGQMVKIDNCTDYIISAEIKEYDISDLKVGMEVLFRTDATRDEIMTGEIYFISPVPVQKTGVASTGAVYEIKAKLQTSNDRLKLGMTAKMNIIYEASDEALSVTYEAIRTDSNGNPFIQVQNIDGSILDIPVSIGVEGDYYIEIISDEIQEGMLVLLPGNGGANQGKE